MAAAPLPSRAPHAHRRPGLVALLYGYRALAGLLIALPAAMALGGPTSAWPRRQAELFDPGGVMLVESLRLGRRAILPVEGSAGAVAAVALLAGIFPLAMLLVGISREGKLTGAFLAGRAWAHAGTLALISGLGALFQALACGLVVVLGAKIVGAFHLAPPAEDLATAAVVAVAVVVGLLAGVLRDLASVAAVRGDHGLYVASARALRCARRRGGRALLAWTWRSALGLAGILLAAWLAPAPGSALAIAAGVMLHQGAILGATFARASWLAAAMRLHDATGPKAEEAEAPTTEGEAPAVSEPSEGAKAEEAPADPPPQDAGEPV